MSHHLSFLGLPSDIRLKIYIFAGLIRVCPINLNHEGSRRTYREDCRKFYEQSLGWDRLRNKPRPELLYCEFWLMRFNLLYYPLGNGGVCQCPVLPFQLLTVCRFIHDEVFDILYSQNKVQNSPR